MPTTPMFNLGATYDEAAPTGPPILGVPLPIPLGGSGEGAPAQQVIVNQPQQPAQPVNPPPIPPMIPIARPPMALHGYPPNQLLADAGGGAPMPPRFQALGGAKLDGAVGGSQPGGAPAGRTPPPDSELGQVKRLAEIGNVESLQDYVNKLPPHTFNFVKEQAETYNPALKGLLKPPPNYDPANQIRTDAQATAAPTIKPPPRAPIAPGEPAYQLPKAAEIEQDDVSPAVEAPADILDVSPNLMGSTGLQARAEMIQQRDRIKNWLSNPANDPERHVQALIQARARANAAKQATPGGRIMTGLKSLAAPNMAAMFAARNPMLEAQQWGARVRQSTWYKNQAKLYSDTVADYNDLVSKIYTQEYTQQRSNRNFAIKQQSEQRAAIPQKMREEVYERYREIEPQAETLEGGIAKNDPKALQIAQDIKLGIIEPNIAHVYYKTYDKHAVKKKNYEEQKWELDIQRRQQMIERTTQVMELAQSKFKLQEEQHALKKEQAKLDKKLKQMRIANAPEKERRAVEAHAAKLHQAYWSIEGKKQMAEERLRRERMDAMKMVAAFGSPLSGATPELQQEAQKYLDAVNKYTADKDAELAESRAATEAYTISDLSKMYTRAQADMKSGKSVAQVNKELKDGTKGVVSLSFLQKTFGGEAKPLPAKAVAKAKAKK